MNVPLLKFAMIMSEWRILNVAKWHLFIATTVSDLIDKVKRQILR